MKVLIACDKFKGTLDANNVCMSIKKGILESNPTFKCDIQPLADGGDGSLDIIKQTLPLEKITIKTFDPLSRQIDSHYLSNRKTAYIELAQSSGIALLKKEEYDALKTNTVGTGVLIKHALESGHKKIILSLGGSCTTDAGLGILYALDYKFKDSKDQLILPTGGNLRKITQILKPKNFPSFDLLLLTDVRNPLYGKNGSAFVFGKQKGASQDEIIILEEGLKHVASLIAKLFNITIDHVEGGGSAGGISGGLYGLLNGKIINGFNYLADLVNLDQILPTYDWIITGEGGVDNHSFQGKVVGEMVKKSNKHNIPISIVCGINNVDQSKLNQQNIKQIVSIMDVASNEADAFRETKNYLTKLGQDLIFDEFIS